MPEPIDSKHRARTPLYLAWRKFRRHTLSLYGGIILIVLYLVMIFAQFLSPYDYTEGAKDKGNFWPTIVHWTDDEGNFTRPYVYNGYKLIDANFTECYVEGKPENAELIAERLNIPLEKVDTQTYPIRLFVRRGEPYDFLYLNGIVNGVFGADIDWFASDLHLFGIVTDKPIDKQDNPPMLYLLGADALGRDVLSRLLYGARVSLTIGIVAVIVSFTIGMLLGGISGYFGGTTDVVIQRLCEMMMMVPGFYLLLALRSSFDATKMTDRKSVV